MIGELKETNLHAALKEYYCELYNGEMEVQVGRSIVDVISEQGDIIEIQTGSFTQIKKKVVRLLEQHAVRIVFPLPVAKIIRVCNIDGEIIRERRAPLRPHDALAARELIRIPELVLQEGFSFDLVHVKVFEERMADGKGSWRRGGVSLTGRILLAVEDIRTFNSPEDYKNLLPKSLPVCFTHRDMCLAAPLSLSQATKLTWFLRKIGMLKQCGKKGKAYLFTIQDGVQ